MVANVLKDLFDRIVNLREVTNSGEEWGRSISGVIKEWKERWAS